MRELQATTMQNGCSWCAAVQQHSWVGGSLETILENQCLQNAWMWYLIERSRQRCQVPPGSGSGRYGFGVFGDQDSVLGDKCSVGTPFSRSLFWASKQCLGTDRALSRGLESWAAKTSNHLQRRTTIWHCSEMVPCRAGLVCSTHARMRNACLADPICEMHSQQNTDFIRVDASIHR